MGPSKARLEPFAFLAHTNLVRSFWPKGLIIFWLFALVQSCNPDPVDAAFLRLESILLALEAPQATDDPYQTAALIGEFERITGALQDLAPPLGESQKARLRTLSVRLIARSAGLLEK